MEPRTVQVLGIRGLRGSPDVLPHQAIGEEQIAAFFAQDGACRAPRDPPGLRRAAPHRHGAAATPSLARGPPSGPGTESVLYALVPSRTLTRPAPRLARSPAYQALW